MAQCLIKNEKSVQKIINRTVVFKITAAKIGGQVPLVLHPNLSYANASENFWRTEYPLSPQKKVPFN